MDDDEQMENEQGDEEIPRVPPAAARFLDRHRPMGISSADRDADRDGEDNDDNDGDRAEDQREADGEVVDGEIVDNPLDRVRPGDPGYRAAPEVPVPPAQTFAPRPRAKGVSHPPVPTRAMIAKHALEQHVNYAAWCPHCLQASALAKKHTPVTGESPSVPTVSADFCFMKGRDADSGDGIPVLVMRESQTRSLFSHACAGKSTSREGYSSFLIEKCVEDIDSVQKDIHLKTDQEPAMIAFQARVQQARKSRTTPAN